MTLVGDEDSSFDSDQSIELIAQLQNAIGAMPMDSSDFQPRVQGWLKAQAFDGVFLIGVDPQDHQRQGVFVAHRFGTSMEYSTQTVEELILTLTRIGFGTD